MAGKKTWSPEEDEILIQCINESPTNYARAFRKCQSLVNNKTFDACQAHWYNSLSKKQKIAIVSIGNGKALPNRRVKRRGCPEQEIPVKRGIWKQILAFFGLK